MLTGLKLLIDQIVLARTQVLKMQRSRESRRCVFNGKEEHVALAWKDSLPSQEPVVGWESNASYLLDSNYSF